MVRQLLNFSHSHVGGGKFCQKMTVNGYSRPFGGKLETFDNSKYRKICQEKNSPPHFGEIVIRY